MKREFLPPLGVLWSLLWRSVLFFPLMALVCGLYIAVFSACFLLLGWGVCYMLMGQWTHAAGCIAGFATIVAPMWWWFRWKADGSERL